MFFFFHLQSPEFFEILWFSRTSCSSPDASERPRRQPQHKPQFPTGHKEEVGRPSSRWGVSFENFQLDHQYCLFCRRKEMTKRRHKYTNDLNMSAVLPFGDLRRLTLGSILVQSWLSSSRVCSTISWYIFMEIMSWLSAQKRWGQWGLRKDIRTSVDL